VRFQFEDSDYEELYSQGKHIERFPPEVVRAFFRVMARIMAAADIRDLYAFKGLRFEKLSGDRTGQCLLRLNDQFQLVVFIEEDAEGQYLVILKIEDYH